MTVTFSKRNVILIPIVILFGVNMFLAATNLTRWTAEKSLETFVQVTVDRWTTKLQPRVDAAFNAQTDEIPIAQVQRLIEEDVLFDTDARYQFFDRSGAAVLDSGQSGSEPEVAEDVPAAHPRLLGIDLPIAASAGDIGVLRVHVDQSDVMHLFYSSHGFVEALSAIFLIAALSVLIFIIWSRIKEQARSDERIRHLAHHDVLTDLPNRNLFIERFGDAVERAKRGDDLVAVLCLDIDQFKSINDTMGHAVGDALLQEFASRLRAETRATDLLCRIGGDEFVIALTHLKSFENIVPFANRLCGVLAEPYEIDGQKFSASASIGVSICPSDGSDTQQLLKFADLALYRAKDDGRNTVRLYERHMDVAFQKRVLMAAELRTALETGQFKLYYQSQLDMESGTTEGQEALIRWDHPDRGIIPPDEFIPMAEETGLIIPLSQWVLETACRDAMGWDHNQYVAVNLSAKQFQAGGVAELVESTLKLTGLTANRLELEITESILLGDTENVLEQLTRLKELGVSVVLDDFGTGYSSLNYLATFRFDKIKIDRTFIEKLEDDGMMDAIIGTIINLTRDLGVIATAAGIETKDQELALRQLGCRFGQGFLYGHPVPKQAVRATPPRLSVVYPRFGSSGKATGQCRQIKASRA